MSRLNNEYMVNKFEAFGIAISVGAMVLALYLIRVETTNNSFALIQEGNQEGAVFVSDDTHQAAAVADAYIEASGGDTTLERLIIDDIVIGEGAEVVDGDEVAVHYIGTLQNGQQFDNSYLRGTPFTFVVGKGRVIEGWEEGILGMKVGGQRILVIPSELAYGSGGSGPIPADATLVFAIELISINE